eukprot:jgi/Botrbrau1/4953/Bobra.0122s0030.1
MALRRSCRVGPRQELLFFVERLISRSVFRYSSSPSQRDPLLRSTPARPEKAPNGKEAQESQQHWLDRYFPSVRPWLEKQNRVWWVESVKARCRHYLQLHGKEDTVAQLLEAKYDQLIDKHQHRITDPRSETHIQNACLAVATQQVLGAWIKDSQELSRIISENMGSHTSPGLRFLLKASLWLTRDPYAQTMRRLRGLSWDYGASFKPELDIQDRVASLQLQSCIYKDIFDSENVSHLLPTSCCSQDKIWFEGLESHGVKYTRTAWFGRGDECCCIKLQRAKD